MKLPRRQFLHLATGAAALPALPRMAKAQAYPSRPVRLIVAYTAGATNDTLGRLLGQWLSERLGQPFVVENRPGGGTNIATEAVIRSPPDGYTLLLSGPANAINATLYEKLNFNFIRDTTPVAGLMRIPNVMLVHPSFPAKDVLQFVAHAKSNPGKVNMASAGIGSATHLAGELFQLMTGAKMIHVPYRGGTQVYTDLLGGQVQVYFAVLSGAVEFIRTGKLRALGVTTAARADALPNVPALGEIVAGYEASSFFGISGPRGLPADIVSKLNSEINATLADDKFKERLADLGGTPLVTSAEEFGNVVSGETEKWANVVKFAGLKPE
jgi:tripartite-type tricarboxylate transporter receptor subunit TctC